VTTALLIRNPVARRPLPDERLAQLLAIARDAGWQIDAVSTDAAGHATELARIAAERGTDVLIVHGGDGTINEAINGIAGTQTALAVLRGGTANVWAKETGCGKDAIASMRIILRGSVRRRVDLGRVNGRYFLLMCGAGLDACIVPAVGARMKRRLGALAYIFAGAREIFTTRGWAPRLAIDGNELPDPLYWMIAGNTRSYGGVANVTHRAIADDGVLDVVLMRRGGILRLIADGARLLIRRHDRSPNIRYTTAREIRIAEPGIPLQVDGEAAGETPCTITCEPLALTVLVPALRESPLFTRPPSSRIDEAR
jgi:YegS/Rv2252/BmrU family lipid kinase